MLPLCSSMHRVNCSVAPAQLLPQLWLFWADCDCTGAAASGLELLPPPKSPLRLLPTTWPMEEPIATPLFLVGSG
jgi:hypothetical protein